MDSESGSVKFVNTNHDAIRLGVSLALTHNFLKQVGTAAELDSFLDSKRQPGLCHVFGCYLWEGRRESWYRVVKVVLPQKEHLNVLHHMFVVGLDIDTLYCSYKHHCSCNWNPDL